MPTVRFIKLIILPFKRLSQRKQQSPKLLPLPIPILHPFRLYPRSFTPSRPVAVGLLAIYGWQMSWIIIYFVLFNILRLTNDIATQMTQCRKQASV